MAGRGKTGQRPTPARRYPDLHDHLDSLDKAGLLVTVKRPINKDTEMHPLVRWQFRGGIEERDRNAFLFTNVIDSKARKYDIPVVVGALAANREIYRIGMGCALERINETWIRAVANPIPPRVVTDAPCHEIVIQGRDLDRPGRGLDGIPVPISTPGWDNGPYTTLSQYITKDPDTGIQNMGIYRGQVKAPRRLGMNPSLELRPGIYTHWEKMKARGEKLPAAVILGVPPCVAYTSAQKLPETMDELHVAGGLAGAPINVVRAKTVDLLVPAEAEFVIEGYIDTEYLEPEGPFGESHGHVNLQEFNAFMEVTCITRRRDAILTSIISQVTPSESSLIKRGPSQFRKAAIHRLAGQPYTYWMPPVLRADLPPGQVYGPATGQHARSPTGKFFPWSKHKMRWFDSRTCRTGWECELMMDRSTRTLSAATFTQDGPGVVPVTESDILSPSQAFRRPTDYCAHAPNTASMLERLAAQRPTTLACMRGCCS